MLAHLAAPALEERRVQFLAAVIRGGHQDALLDGAAGIVHGRVGQALEQRLPRVVAGAGHGLKAAIGHALVNATSLCGAHALLAAAAAAAHATTHTRWPRRETRPDTRPDTLAPRARKNSSAQVSLVASHGFAQVFQPWVVAVHCPPLSRWRTSSST